MNTTVKVIQSNLLQVTRTNPAPDLITVPLANQGPFVFRLPDGGMIGSTPPSVLRQDVGIIGPITDVFALTSPAAADILVFDGSVSRYKNVHLSGAVTVNTSGVAVLGSIDCGIF